MSEVKKTKEQETVKLEKKQLEDVAGGSGESSGRASELDKGGDAAGDVGTYCNRGTRKD